MECVRVSGSSGHCKTVIPRFKSGWRLQLFLQVAKALSRLTRTSPAPYSPTAAVPCVPRVSTSIPTLVPVYVVEAGTKWAHLSDRPALAPWHPVASAEAGRFRNGERSVSSLCAYDDVGRVPRSHAQPRAKGALRPGSGRLNPSDEGGTVRPGADHSDRIIATMAVTAAVLFILLVLAVVWSWGYRVGCTDTDAQWLGAIANGVQL